MFARLPFAPVTPEFGSPKFGSPEGKQLANPAMFEKLKEVEKRFEELNALLCDPRVIADMERFKKYGKEQSEISELVDVYRAHVKTKNLFDGNRSLIDDGEDAELTAIAKEENEELTKKLAKLEERLKKLLLPRDPDDSKNVIQYVFAFRGQQGFQAGADEHQLFGVRRVQGGNSLRRRQGRI